MLRTTAAVATALFGSRSNATGASGAGDAAVGFAGFIVYALMLLLALLMPALLGVGLLSWEKDLTRFSQAPEKSFAVDAAKFYKAVIPQAAFDAYAALPKGKLQPGEPGYKPGVGVKADFENAKWGLLALYYAAACLFFALQLAIVFGLMFLFAKVWAPLMWIPFFAAIVHYALPFYFLSHFRYMKFMH